MGIQNNLKICDSSCIFQQCSSSGNFYGSEIQHGIFGGFSLKPWDFLGFDFSPHSIIPVT